jgi:hypothetical protein
MLQGLTDAVCDAAVGFGERMTSPLSQLLLHQLSGAMSRVPQVATAFPASECRIHDDDRSGLDCR